MATEGICKFRKLIKDESPSHAYTGSQTETDEVMRVFLVDWLIEVPHGFEPC